MKAALSSLFILAALGLTLGGCASGSSHNAMQHESSGTDHQASRHEHGAATAAPSTVRAVWNWPQSPLQAKQTAGLSIRIEDAAGQPVPDFDIEHEKLMHLIVVSHDLSYFAHIHPDYQGNGQFNVQTEFPAGGSYKLFADFVPKGQDKSVQSTTVQVAGDIPASVNLQPDADKPKTVDGKLVTLSVSGLAAGKETTLTFTIKDAATGQPITKLQPYLGAVGHVVIVSGDTEQYLHVHPMDEQATGPDAVFMTTFPKSGLYKIWGQFQYDNRVFTVPFVVSVP